MQSIKNAWYGAIYSRDLTRDLAPRRILDQAIVLFRGDDGRATALLDRCPHRGAPLSSGRRVEGNAIMCGYHGLRFGAGGECLHNPHGDQRIPAGMVVRAFPTAEKYGLVWVWTGERAPDFDALPDFPMFEAGSGFATGNPDWLRMQAPWDLVIDNLMDLTHTSFLHDGLLGQPEMAANAIKVERNGHRISVLRHFENQSPPEYYDLMFKRDGAPANLWQNAHWAPPSTVLVHNGIYSVGDEPEAAAEIYAAHVLTPETADTTLYHIIAGRKRSPRTPPQDPDGVNERFAELRRIAFTEQDDPMITAQARRLAEAEPPFRPTLLPIDAGVSQWRRAAERLLKDEHATGSAAKADVASS